VSLKACERLLGLAHELLPRVRRRLVTAILDRLDDSDPRGPNQGRRCLPGVPQLVERVGARLCLRRGVELELPDDVVRIVDRTVNAMTANTKTPTIDRVSNAAFHIGKSLIACSNWSVGIDPPLFSYTIYVVNRAVE